MFEGNDNTGDGSKNNPFQTLFKAVHSVGSESNFEVQFIPLHNMPKEKG